MKISMILPIYNESKTIDTMLQQLDNLPGDWEILFADGGSTDDTKEKIGDRYTVLDCPKGRANQMNFAAKQASCDVIWFVHCDSHLPKDAHAQISRAVENGAAWGCFHIGFDYDGPFMGCNTYFSNRRARRGIAFGDQGIWAKKIPSIRSVVFRIFPLWKIMNSPCGCRKPAFPLPSFQGASSPPVGGTRPASLLLPCGICFTCGVCTAEV